MTLRATVSPAWLGIFAALSFGCLVIASFASGYHLVMITAPRGALAASEDNPAAEPRAAADLAGAAPSAPATDDTAGAVGGSVNSGLANGGLANGGPANAGPAKGGARGPSTTGASDPAEAIVRTNLPPNRAVVRSRPETGGIVARLPSNQRVNVRGRQGQWVRVEFDRKGKHVLGWTLETNLQLR
jgi:hypothetical protein